MFTYQFLQKYEAAQLFSTFNKILPSQMNRLQKLYLATF